MNATNNNATHSPAPFRWQNGTLVDARGMGVAKMVPNVYPAQEPQHEADRALLAAAPDLLAALEWALGRLPTPSHANTDEYLAGYAVAADALSRARGA